VWKTFEENNGTSEDVARVEGMMPIIGKKRNVEQGLDNDVEGMHLPLMMAVCLAQSTSDREYVFPDDERESTTTSFKFLQFAHAWKKSQAGAAPTATARETTDKDSDVASSNESD
jgi:crooked neck